MLSFPSQPTLCAEMADWMHTAAECLPFCLFGMTVTEARPTGGGAPIL